MQEYGIFPTRELAQRVAMQLFGFGLVARCRRVGDSWAVDTDGQRMANSSLYDGGVALSRARTARIGEMIAD